MSEGENEQQVKQEQKQQKKPVVNLDLDEVDLRDFSSRELYQSAYVELIGSFFFAFLGQGAIITLNKDAGGAASVYYIAFSQSIILGLLIFATIESSGGNYNPLVSFGLFTSGIISFPRMIVYIIAQIIGMTLASVAMIQVLNLQNEPNLTAGQIGGSSFGENVEGQFFVMEVVVDFLFIFIIHSAAADSGQAKLFRPHISPILIGITCFIGIISSALLIPGSGGACFNPARALGPSIATGDYNKKWIYVIGPIVASVIHSYMYGVAPYKKR